MKLVVLCILIFCVFGLNAVLVDDFAYPIDNPFTDPPENQVLVLQPSLDASSGTFIVPVSTSNGVAGLPPTSVLGGSRDILVEITEAGSRNRAEVIVGRSCEACPDDVFNFNVAANIRARTTVWWDGPDTTIDESFRGLNGVDLTEGGAHDAFRLTVGSSDLNAVVQMIVFSNATHASTLEFNPNNIPQNPGVNVARAITLPFADLVTVAGAAGPADLTDVGMVKMIVKAPDNIPLDQAAIDLQIALIETVPVVRVTKIDTVLDVGIADGIAAPGERIKYTVFVRNRADLAGARARGVVFVDDPRSFSNFLTLVPGTVTAYIGGFDSEIDIAPGQPQPIIRKGNNPGDEFVVIEIGDLFDGQSSTIEFEVMVTTLPCCGINICDYPEPAGPGIPIPCQVAGQDTQAGAEGCKCVHNQAYSCSNSLDYLAEILVTGIAGRQCAPSDDNATEIANPDFTRTPIFASPDPSITIERLGTGDVLGGAAVDFIVSYANAALRGSAEQTVTVTIPAGTTFSGDSSIWTCNTATARCTTNVGALSANAGIVNIPYQLTVNTPLGCDSVGFEVDATIGRTTPANSSCDCRDINLDNNQDSVTVPISGTPDVTISKSYVGDAVTANEVVIYEITYSNVGTRIATGTTIYETIPENAVFESSASTNGWSCSGNTCTFTVGNIGTGETGAINFAVRVTSVLFCDLTEILNTVSINNTCGDSNMDNNNDFEVVPIEGIPDLTITVTDDDASAAPGQDITYRINYSNIGTREATNTRLFVSVPQYTTFKSGTDGFTLSGARYSLNVGSLLPGASGSATFVVTVDATLPCGPDMTNIDVEITNDCGEADVLDNEDSEPTPLLGAPDMTITKSADVTTVEPSGVITYTLTYTNLGTRGATNVVITENYDPDLTVELSLSPQFTECVIGRCTATIGDVAPGASGSVVFVVRLPAGSECNPGNVLNEVTVTNDCGDSNPNNNADTETVAVTAIPDLSITSVYAHDLSPGTPDATTTVTIEYANLGNAQATNTVIRFTIPQHTVFNADESSGGWTCNSATPVVCDYFVGDVDPNDVLGGSVLIAFTVSETVDCGVLDTSYSVLIENDCGEGDDNNNHDSDIIPIVAEPVLTVVKDDNEAEFKQRTTVRYDITYSNTGRRSLTNAFLEDQVPENTRVELSASDAGWQCPNGVNGPTTCTKVLGELDGLSNGNTYIVLAIVDPIPRGLREVTNVVNLDGDTELCGGEPTEDEEPTPVIGNPDLTVTKTDLDVSVYPGEIITYNIQYNNIGERDSTGVVITERVPTHTTFVAASSTDGWSCSDGASAGTVCTFRIDSLPTFSPATIQFAVRVVNPVTCAVTSTPNEVSIRDDGNNGAELSMDNNNDNEVTPILGLPNLFVNIDDGIPDGEPVAPGEIIRYTINYGHVISGPLASVREATNVVVELAVPEHTSFVRVESSGAWSCADGSGPGTVCSISAGNLKPTDPVRTVSFAVRVVKPFPTGVDSTSIEVTVNNECGEADASDNVDDDETPLEGNPDLIIQKHGRCAAFQWNITFGNIGDQVARDVILTSHVPLDTIFNADLSHNLWECAGTQSGSECHLRVGNVNPGETGTISFVTDTLPHSMLSEVVHMTTIHDWRGDDLDPTPDNNRATATISGSGCAECDSCCPPVEECCPDQTHVSFNFQGVLDGLNECD